VVPPASSTCNHRSMSYTERTQIYFAKAFRTALQAPAAARSDCPVDYYTAGDEKQLLMIKKLLHAKASRAFAKFSAQFNFIGKHFA